jgi:hypothetical protein
MSTSPLIRPYRPGDEHAILRLFNRVFAEDDPGFSPRTLEQWRWEFTDNPAGLQITLALDDHGEVMAQYTTLPYFAWLKGERVLAHQGVDSIVHPDHRRGLKKEGVFLATARAFFEEWGRPERVAFGFGFPNKKVYRLGLRMLEYLPVETPVPTLYRNLFQRPDDDEVGKPTDRSGVVELASLDDRVDRLWRACAGDLQLALVRDRAYLQWRYVQCPLARHRLFALPDERGELRGLMVTRAQWQNAPILAVMDWLVPARDPGTLAVLLRHAVVVARAEGQQRVETWLPASSPHRAVILARGFGEEPCYANLCVKPYRRDLDLDWMRRHWYYTIGDSDVF